MLQFMKTLQYAESGQTSGNATFHAELPSLLQRCDNRLMGLCQRLCYWLGRFLLLGLGVAMFDVLFGHLRIWRGIADMDIVERGTLLLLIFLLCVIGGTASIVQRPIGKGCCDHCNIGVGIRDRTCNCRHHLCC